MSTHDHRVTVVIDPGHGGQSAAGRSTPHGVRGPGGTLEKDVNLDLAQRVASHLGSQAVLTRSSDQNLSLGERCAIAQRYGARVFLSLHANEGPPGSRGAELFVHPRAPQRSHSFADALQRELATFGNPTGGARSADLAVLSPDRLAPDTAACLMEVDYLSSPEGERRLRDARSLDQLGSSIARGVHRYLGGAAGAASTAPRRFPVSYTLDDSQNTQVERDPAKSFFEIVDDDTAAVAPNAAVSSGAGYARGLEGSPVDTIVNVAKTAWDVMKDNRPVANATSDFANAIPQGASIADMAGWAATPRTMRLHYHSGNAIDINTTDIYLTFSWYYNGAYLGAGQYINAATVIATGDVAWGNTINVVASINNPMNLGTRDAPIASLPIRIRLTESNFLQSLTQAWDGIVEGNGAGRVTSV
jgi:N-acetylmuramoyl-L-alanine amidase